MGTQRGDKLIIDAGDYVDTVADGLAELLLSKGMLSKGGFLNLKAGLFFNRLQREFDKGGVVLTYLKAALVTVSWGQFTVVLIGTTLYALGIGHYNENTFTVRSWGEISTIVNVLGSMFMAGYTFKWVRDFMWAFMWSISELAMHINGSFNEVFSKFNKRGTK